MNENINLSLKDKVNYKYLRDKYQTIICHKECIFKIGKQSFLIQKHGTARCNPKDEYDEEFGKALAWIRASQKIGHQAENILISYSVQNSMKQKENKSKQETYTANVKCDNCGYFDESARFSVGISVRNSLCPICKTQNIRSL